MTMKKTMADISTMLDQAKSQHTICDKITGKVLGYALLTTDQHVAAEQMTLVPWCEGVQNPPDAGPAGGVQAPGGGDRLQGTLLSELDLSQDSSVNETFEEHQSSQTNDQSENQGKPLPNTLRDLNYNKFEASSEEAKSGKSNFNSICPPPFTVVTETPPSLPNPPATKASASNLSASGILNPVECSPAISSPLVLSPPKPVIRQVDSIPIKEAVPTKLKSLTQSLASEIAANLKGEKIVKPSCVASSNEPSNLSGKRSLEGNIDINLKKKKVENKSQFMPGMKGRHDAFCEVVEEGLAKNQRVKCLLCGDGKLLSRGNFNRHIKAIHEPPVKCDICGKLFNGEWLKVHRKKCVWLNLDFVEKTGLIVQDDSLSPIPLPIADPSSNRLESPSACSSVSTSTTETSPGTYEKEKDEVSISVESQVSNPNFVGNCLSPFPLPASGPSHDLPESAINTSASTSVSTSTVESSPGNFEKNNDEVPISVESQPKASKCDLLKPSSMQTSSTGSDGDWAYLVMTSSTVDDVRVKMKIKKGNKIKKAMKTFGKKHNIDYQSLRFLLGSSELTGEEIVRDLEGNEIDVFGEI